MFGYGLVGSFQNHQSIAFRGGPPVLQSWIRRARHMFQYSRCHGSRSVEIAVRRDRKISKIDTVVIRLIVISRNLRDRLVVSFLIPLASIFKVVAIAGEPPPPLQPAGQNPYNISAFRPVTLQNRKSSGTVARFLQRNSKLHSAIVIEVGRHLIRVRFAIWPQAADDVAELSNFDRHLRGAACTLGCGTFAQGLDNDLDARISRGLSVKHSQMVAGYDITVYLGKWFKRR